MIFKVDENPFGYDGHIELIKYLQEVGELESLRQARQKMSELFPLTEGMYICNVSGGYGRNNLP